MLFRIQDSAPFAQLDAPQASILRECLELTPFVPVQPMPADATALDERSREIERLKMTRPRAAAEQADRWLLETLRSGQHQSNFNDIESFCSALSTWGSIQRQLGRRSDAAHAQAHALSLLCSRPCTTLTGFILHRLAFALADLGDIPHGLICSHQAVAVHELTPGGERNRAIAVAGLAAFHLFYRRAFIPARASYRDALEVFGPSDASVFAVSARQGLAYSYLMEGRGGEARKHLEAARSTPLESDQELRLDWMEAEIDASEGKAMEALERYESLFPLATDIMEASGAMLLALDASTLLIDEHHSKASRWIGWMKPIVERLDRPERLSLEPYWDALVTGELDRELLDQTVVAFKKARDRMLLAVGRPRAAGRPDLMGRVA